MVSRMLSAIISLAMLRMYIELIPCVSAVIQSSVKYIYNPSPICLQKGRRLKKMKVEWIYENNKNDTVAACERHTPFGNLKTPDEE